MTFMTDAPKPPFPFAAFATPEDIRKASEQAMNLWVGALSPMWVPFLAASGFGLSAYSASKTLQKELLEDMPLAARWPGFTPLWGQHDFTPEAFEAPVLSAVQTATDVVDTVAEPMVEEAETAIAPIQTAAETIIDPVIEAPVVPAVVEAVAEPVISPEPIAKAVAPKPLARELAVAKAKPVPVVTKPAAAAKPAIKAMPAKPVAKPAAPKSPKLN